MFTVTAATADEFYPLVDTTGKKVGSVQAEKVLGLGSLDAGIQDTGRYVATINVEPYKKYKNQRYPSRFVTATGTTKQAAVDAVTVQFIEQELQVR